MSGGFFEGARLWTGLIVWAAVAVMALAGRLALPRGAGLVVVGSLAALAIWTAVSIAWSPLKDPALGDAERVVTYVGFLLLAISLLRDGAAELTAPSLAAGTVIVGGYAVATRLLPTLIHSHLSLSAGARLDQPLTYWNALGAVMAIGIVLLIQVAADERWHGALRAAALAAAPVNGLALYLTFSRGSLAALAVGVVVLLVLQRTRRALALAVAALVASGVIAAFASAFAAVDSLAGDAATRRNEGLIVLAALGVVCLAAAAAERAVAAGILERLGRRALEIAVVAGVLAVIVGAVFIVGRNPEPTPQEVPSQGANLPTNRARLATLKTNRYDYWKVALHGFGDKPLEGVGAHGFQALWLERRDIGESAQDAHSLYIETLAELGVIGFAFLLAFLVGAFLCLRRALANPGFRPSAVGWAAASAAGFVHAGVDWDWEMPAVFLILLCLLGAAIAAAGDPVVDRDRG